MALDPERAGELFASFGPVRCRRMFSGTGVYSGDVMFALEARDVLYLKSDESTAAAFEAEGCEPFGYATKTGRRVLTSYRRIPDRLLDDPDELAAWARKARAIAGSKRTTPRRSRTKSM